MKIKDIVEKAESDRALAELKRALYELMEHCEKGEKQ